MAEGEEVIVDYEDQVENPKEDSKKPAPSATTQVKQ